MSTPGKSRYGLPLKHADTVPDRSDLEPFKVSVCYGNRKYTITVKVEPVDTPYTEFATIGDVEHAIKQLDVFKRWLRGSLHTLHVRTSSVQGSLEE